MKESYTLPKAVSRKAKSETRLGVKVCVSPKEIVQWMRKADRALNGTSNDEEHDTLYGLREWLSEIYEDSDRRI